MCMSMGMSISMRVYVHVCVNEYVCVCECICICICVCICNPNSAKLRCCVLSIIVKHCVTETRNNHPKLFDIKIKFFLIHGN
jgi:hypothetical protein